MEFELFDPPSDGITSLSFAPSTSTNSTNRRKFLLACSWDSSAYLYDASSNLPMGKWPVGSALLDGCFWGRDARGVAHAVGLSRQIHRLDLGTGQSRAFGEHGDAIKCIRSSVAHGTIFTGSWDKSVGVWDERTEQRVTSLPLPDKCYSMDLCDDKNLLLVATAGRHIHLYDTRALSSGPLQRRESSLKYQTRTVRFFADGEGFVCGSIEGRVGVDWIDAREEVQAQRYAFKCHRQPAQTVDPATGAPMEIVYPVNALCYHPRTDCFFTGGSDGVVNSWDRVARKRIRQFPKYATSISAMDIDPSGELLAIAVSYAYEQGEKDHPPESIFIRQLEESDIKSKSSLKQ